VDASQRTGVNQAPDRLGNIRQVRLVTAPLIDFPYPRGGRDQVQAPGPFVVLRPCDRAAAWRPLIRRLFLCRLIACIMPVPGEHHRTIVLGCLGDAKRGGLNLFHSVF